MNGIQMLQQFIIYVHPKCVNTIMELSNYVWNTDKSGQMVNKPIDDYNHLMDALRYAVQASSTRQEILISEPITVSYNDILNSSYFSEYE